jgi:hypothetical protein
MIGGTRSSNTSSSVVEPVPGVQTTSPSMFFLGRLYRLVELRGRPNLDPAQRRQVNHALYSSYWDCVGLGMRSQATTILELPPQE